MKKIILWILVISAMTAIFLFSSQEADESSKLSCGLIISIVEFFDVKGSLSAEEIRQIAVTLNHIVRTGAHFTVYAVLGFLSALLLKEYGFYGKKLVLYSAIGSFLYACTDELHQSFVPGRSAQAIDIVVDTAGALSGALLVILIMKIYRKITR